MTENFVTLCLLVFMKGKSIHTMKFYSKGEHQRFRKYGKLLVWSISMLMIIKYKNDDHSGQQDGQFQERSTHRREKFHVRSIRAES